MAGELMNVGEVMRAILQALSLPQAVTLPANQSVNQAQVAGAATATNAGAPSSGTQRVVQALPATPAVTTVAGTALATSQVLVAAAAARQGVVVQNDTNKLICLRAGGAAGVNDYSLTLAAGGLYEIPPAFSAVAWQVIASDAAAGTGLIRVTAVS